MEFINNIVMAVGLVTLVGCCGAAFTLGVALTCRWLSWAPISIIVNNNKYNE